MKKNLMLAMATAMVAPVWSAPSPHSGNSAPVTLNAPSLAAGAAWKQGFDYNFQWTDLDWGNSSSPDMFGVKLGYERAVGHLGSSQHTWSLLGEVSAVMGSDKIAGGRDMDITLGTLCAGANLNIEVSPSAVLFAGPRLGVSRFNFEPKGGEDSHKSAFSFGVSGGLRVFVDQEKQNAVQIGVEHACYLLNGDGDDKYSSTSFFLGGVHMF